MDYKCERCAVSKSRFIVIPRKGFLKVCDKCKNQMLDETPNLDYYVRIDKSYRAKTNAPKRSFLQKLIPSIF